METIKLPEENIGGEIFDICIGKDFLDLTPKAKETKQKINKWDYIKLKCSCNSKGTVKKIKRSPTEWVSGVCGCRSGQPPCRLPWMSLILWKYANERIDFYFLNKSLPLIGGVT